MVLGELTVGLIDDPLLRAVVRTDYESQYWFFLERTFLYSGEGETKNQRAIGRYIDQVGIYPNGDYRNVLTVLDQVRAQEGVRAREERALGNNYVPPAIDPLYTAFDQIGGAIYGTATTASFQNTVMFHAALTNVLRRDYNNIGALTNQGYLGQVPDPNMNSGRKKFTPSNNLWGMIYGHAGMMHDDGNARTYNQGFSGIMAGMDRINENRVRLGFFLSMGEGSLSSELKDRMLSKEIMAGHYFRKDTDNGYVLIQAGVGNHNNDARRHIDFIDRTATSKYNSFLATAHVETGLLYHGGVLNLSPFVGAQFTGLVREGFTERGAGSLNLTTDMQAYSSLRSMFGMRFDSQPFRMFRGLAAFYGNVAWMYEFELGGKRHSEFTARFSDA
jgi:outer membrane autotransporter protein